LKNLAALVGANGNSPLHFYRRSVTFL